MSGALNVDARLSRGAFKLAAEFQAPPHTVTALFGPSGAGKSLLLTAIAGLTEIEAGSIAIDGVTLNTPAWRRGIGLVFQDARLFPHLDVRGNLAFAAKRAPEGGWSIDEAARQTGCSHLLGRAVARLSGGERNRVALARALLARPRLLLLDEPFAALDGAARVEFLALLRALHNETGVAMVIVTHQIDDAAFLADRLVALEAGRVVASGALASKDITTALQHLLDRRDTGVALPSAALTRPQGATGAHVWVRADHVLLASAQPRGLSARNLWAGTVTSITAEPDFGVLVGVDTSAGFVWSRVTPNAVADLDLSVGSPVWTVVKAHSI